MFRSPLGSAALLAACLAGGAVHAQPIYRSVMPDGKIVFGDKPAPGAKESKQISVRPPNVATPGTPGSGGLSPQQQNLENATNDVNTAQQNLDRARAALESGREPKPEERIGTKTGMRTTEAYDQRIKTLELEVSNAQKQLDDALQQRNQSR